MRRININEYLYIDYDLEADNSVNNKDAKQYSIPKNIKLHNIPNSDIIKLKEYEAYLLIISDNLN